MPKRSLILLGVLALLAIWQISGVHTPVGEVDRPVAQSATPERIHQEAPGRSEPIARLSASQREAAEEPETGTPDPCVELARALQREPNVFLGLNDDRTPDDSECGIRLQMALAPMAPALPGLPGFEVRDLGSLVVVNPRARLFEEADTPDWSRAMEGRIYDEIGTLIDFPIPTLHAVCRTSTCGLVFVFSNGEQKGRNYHHYAQELADALGFSGYYVGVSTPPSGMWHMTIYLGDWETPRRDLPYYNIFQFKQGSNSEK